MGSPSALGTMACVGEIVGAQGDWQRSSMVRHRFRRFMTGLKSLFSSAFPDPCPLFVGSSKGIKGFLCKRFPAGSDRQSAWRAGGWIDRQGSPFAFELPARRVVRYFMRRPSSVRVVNGGGVMLRNGCHRSSP